MPEQSSTSQIADSRRILLLCEFSLLFVAVPLLFFFEPLPLPKFAGLFAMTAYCALLLWRGGGPRPPFWQWRLVSLNWRRLLLRATLGALALAALVLITRPDAFLRLPRERPTLWLAIMILYPLVSVLPQELIYRTFIWRRYQPLFGDGEGLVWASALAFAFVHIVYDNLPAVVLCLIGGLWLARTYQRTRSLLLVSLEHAAYGMLVFTLGAGRWFYEG